MRRVSVLAAAAALSLAPAAGCTVDTSELEPIHDYASWPSVESRGAIPAHGDTIRITYVNDVGRAYPHSGAYAIGTVLVKEIRAADDGVAGELDYVAVMRKLAEDDVPGGAALEGGWLFTWAGDPADLGDSERTGRTCWEDCHVQGPIDGAYRDYGIE